VNQSSATVVIGIPTVRRERNYLLHTVKSIIEGISPSDRNHCRIVILDGDVEPADNPVLERIKRKWPELISAGWITIWRSTHSFDFSSAENLKQRWQWKQSFDCAELFTRCAPLADYYLHVEDDAIASPSYFAQIIRRLESHLSRNSDWRILSFYNSLPIADDGSYSESGLYCRYFGLIGQLIRCRDLPEVARFIHTHYTAAPVDVLVGQFVIKTGGRVYAHSPSLFQHVGVISSLEGRVQMWEAPDFREKLWKRLRREIINLRDVCIYEPKALAAFVPFKLKLRSSRHANVLKPQ
jgi:hypothetical protein